MGNSGSKESCGNKRRSPSAESCSNKRGSLPTGQAGSDSSLRPSSEQPSWTSTQASIHNLFQGLRFGVKDVTDLEKILKFIAEALDKQRKRSSMRVDMPDLVSGNLEDAGKALGQILELCQPEVGNNNIAMESRTLFGKALEGLGSLHWVTAAFSMVAFVLRRLDQVAENKESCFYIFEILQQLGEHLVYLFKRLPNEEEKFKWAASIIVEGAILCRSLLDSTYASRFALVNAAEDNISALREKIRFLYSELSLILSKEMHRQMSKPLQPYKAQYPEYAVGLEQTVHDVMSILEATQREATQREATQREAQQKTPALLLYGMGGIGKTTLGEAVCAKISERMSISVAKVEVGENPTTERICKCQNDICERLGAENQRIGDPFEGRLLLASHFKQCNSPILLFIDNVFEKEDLEKLLPSKLNSPWNSYMLVTSRYETISQALHGGDIAWKTYDVRGLAGPEAKTLLNNLLDGCPTDKEEQLKSVLDLCGGWPLALEVIGSHLRSQKNDPYAWNSTITRLKRGKDVRGRAEDQLGKILKWSYNEVDTDCKNVFLDICCLLKDAEWEWIETLGAGAELDTLKAFSLIKRGQTHSWEDMIKQFQGTGYFYPRCRVQVHDLFLTLGEQESSSTGIRLYSSGDSLPSVLQADQSEDKCKHIEGLVLQGGRWPISLLAKKLDAMHKSLRILRLGWNLEIQGECRQTPSKLQICSVRGKFPYRDFSGLQDLRVLDIRDSAVNFDFEQVQLPKSLQNLQLTWIRSLKRFHENAFANCNSLHTVRIARCFRLKELPSSICFCPIRVLVLSGNSMLKSLPLEFSRLQSLETFCFTGSVLQEFPTGLADLKKLREIFLRRFRVLSQRVDVSQLSRLEHLDFECEGAEGTGHGLGKLSALRTLRVKGWRGLQRLSDDLLQLTSLETLSLKGFGGLQRLPDGLGQLVALKHLSLKGCELLTEIPEGFGNLPELSKLHLRRCKSLQRLPSDFGQLTAMRSISFEGCESLEELPEGFGNFFQLSELNLARCRSLRRLPQGFGQLTALKSLTLGGCDSLRRLPEGFGNPSGLLKLHLSECESLQQLPDSFGQLMALRQLTLEKYDRHFTSIDFSALRSSLNALTLVECQSLTELPAGFGNLVSLSRLELRGCRSLSRLAGDFSQLTSLLALDISECEALEELPSGFGSLLGLRILTLDGCDKLQQLPDTFPRLESLQQLALRQCKSLKQLPGGFENLPRLFFLDLTGCSSLEKLPEGFGELVALQEVLLGGCKSLEVLPESVVHLKKLRALYLTGCEFHFLPSDFGDLRALRVLDLSQCTKLEAIPETMARLNRLEYLNIRNCRPEVQCSQVVTQWEAKPEVEVVLGEESDVDDDGGVMGRSWLHSPRSFPRDLDW